MKKTFNCNLIVLSTFAALLTGTSVPAFAQTFVRGPQLTYIFQAGVDWGDCDNDGDLDLLVVGGVSPSFEKKIFRNENGSFLNDINENFPYFMGETDVQWMDYNNDGIMDYVIGGTILNCPYSPLMKGRYVRADGRNVPEYAEQQPGILLGIRRGSMDWGDYDNDGDEDLAMCGQDHAYVKTAGIFHNDRGYLNQASIGLVVNAYPTLQWVDFDNDMDVDLLITGDSQVALYSNNMGVLTPIPTNIPALGYGDLDWGDYDNDGDLDLAMVGQDAAFQAQTRIFRNDGGGNFTDIPHNIPSRTTATIQWADYDNDGDLDLLVSGDSSYNSVGNYISDVYRNDGSNIFTPINAIQGVYEWSFGRWGDADNDGDLDFFLTGRAASGTPPRAGHIFYNQLPAANANTLPATPTGLSAAVTNYNVQLAWNQATDNETPQDGLSYNYMMGTTPGGIEICSPLSDVTTGYRRKVHLGNAYQNNGWVLRNLAPGQYWWSVQSIDQAFAGSQFAPLETFIILDTLAPTLDYPFQASKQIPCNSTASWHAFQGALSYHVQFSKDTLFATVDFDFASVPDTSLLMPLLEFNTTYFWRVSANLPGGASPWSYVRYFQTIPHFTEVATGIEEGPGDGAWGDYDSDGDQDLLLSGIYWPWLADILQNNSGTLNLTGTGLQPSRGLVAWQDVDNDNHPDLTLLGRDVSSINHLSIYHNSNGSFNSIFNTMVSGMNNYSVAWGDYDNDGDDDVIIVGEQATTIYRNDDSTFTDIGASVPNMAEGNAVWADYDNDRDLDLAMLGRFNNSLYTKIYRNDNGVFTDINASLPGCFRGKLQWADFDLDGDLDIALTGQNYTSQWNWEIYRNDGGNFVLHQSIPDQITYSDLAWGDFDNDGDPDIAIAGMEMMYVYQNDAGTFNRISCPFTGIDYPHLNWCDYDNDHDLDLFVSGYFAYTNYIDYPVTLLYRNNTCHPNSLPNPPSGLTATLDTVLQTLTLNWGPGSDAETPVSGLQYNLYVGSSPSTTDVRSPLADLSTGYRKVTQLGNANMNLGWLIQNVPSGTYYWSVQTIDQALEGSAFAPEQQISLLNGTEEHGAIRNEFTLYPNPVHGSYTIFYSGNANESLLFELFDATGKKVMEKRINTTGKITQFQLDQGGIEQGIYSLRISGGAQTQVGKIVFQ